MNVRTFRTFDNRFSIEHIPDIISELSIISGFTPPILPWDAYQLRRGTGVDERPEAAMEIETG